MTDQSLVDRLQSRGRRAGVPPSVARRRALPFLRVAIMAFALFFALAMLVRRNHRMEADVIATMRVQRIRHPLLMRVMNAVSWFGFRPQSLLLPAGITSTFWLLGFRRDARYLGAAWLGSMLSYTTKRIVQRPRPQGEGISVVKADLRDSSFPSGHVLHYVCFWGFFAYLCSVRMRGHWQRWTPLAGIAPAIGMVGPSRIYLGHHWLTDVLGSYTLGTGYLATLIGLHRRRIDEPADPASG